MPIRYAISEAHDLLFAEWTGRVSYAEWEANYARYLADPDYVPGRREFLDCSGLEDFEVNFALVRGILREVNRRVPDPGQSHETVALVPGGVVFGIARMFQSLAENAQGVQTRLCRDESEALALLNLPHANLAALRRDPEFALNAPIEITEPLRQGRHPAA